MESIRVAGLRSAVLVASLFVSSPVMAQVSEYSDMWPSEEVDNNGNGTLYLYGSASADGDGWLRMQMRTYDPNGTSVSLGLANGYYFVEKEKSISIAANAVMGEYRNVVTVDYEFVHYACATKAAQLSSGIKTYMLDFVIDSGKARYVRCNGNDWCPSIIAGKNRINPPQPTWPLYLFISVTRVNIGIIKVCWGHDAQVTTACLPDPM